MILLLQIHVKTELLNQPRQEFLRKTTERTFFWEIQPLLWLGWEVTIKNYELFEHTLLKNKRAVVKNCYPNLEAFGSLSLAGADIVICRASWDWKEAYLSWFKNQLGSSLQALSQPFLPFHLLFFPSTSQADFQGQLDPLVSILKFTHKPGEVYKALQLRFITRGLVCAALNPWHYFLFRSLV